MPCLAACGQRLLGCVQGTDHPVWVVAEVCDVETPGAPVKLTGAV